MRIGIKVSTRRFVLLDTDEIYFLESDDHDWELKLDPPVNSVLPVGRGHLAALRRSLGI
jgi:hypothetical protein